MRRAEVVAVRRAVRRVCDAVGVVEPRFSRAEIARAWLAEGFDPSEPRDEAGRWAKAAGEMAAAHPFPGEPPHRPPGTGRPDLRAKHPELAAADAAHQAWMVRKHHAIQAETMRRMLTDKPPRDVPLSDNPRVAVSRTKQAIEQADAAHQDLEALTSGWQAGFRADVTGSHPHGKEVLKAAHEEAVRRRAAAVKTAKEHVAALPSGQREKAEKLLARVIGAE